MPYEYRYPRPALTVDCAVFSPGDAGDIEVLLVERGHPPFKGEWATPGGFVDIDETVSDAASRELEEETGLGEIHLAPFGVFDAPDRDPRGRVVAVGHWALVDRHAHNPAAATDAASCSWQPAENLPDMAFDHRKLVAEALEALRLRAARGVVGIDALEDPFSFDEIHELYDVLLGGRVDRGMLREALVSTSGALEPVPTDDGVERFTFSETGDGKEISAFSPWIDASDFDLWKRYE